MAPALVRLVATLAALFLTTSGKHLLSACSPRNSSAAPAVFAARVSPRQWDAPMDTFPALRAALTARDTPVHPKVSAMLDEWVTAQQALAHTCGIMLVCSGSKVSGHTVSPGHCEGLGDQLHGVRTAFWMAQAANCSLFIGPRPAFAFLQPNRVDWSHWGPAWFKVKSTARQGYGYNHTHILADIERLQTPVNGRPQMRIINYEDWKYHAMLAAVEAAAPHHVVEAFRLQGWDARLPFDTLFAPTPVFVRQYLVPALRHHPSFTAPGPSVCLHIRTGVVDRKVLNMPHISELLGTTTACLQCLAAEASPAFKGTVFLASDAPPNQLPLPSASYAYLPNDRGRVHIATGENNEDSLLWLAVDYFAMSLCDILVHSASGFSHSAAQWGGIPPSNIRQFQRLYPWREVPGDGYPCPGSTYDPEYSLL